MVPGKTCCELKINKSSTFGLTIKIPYRPEHVLDVTGKHVGGDAWLTVVVDIAGQASGVSVV